MSAGPTDEPGDERRARIRAARLYLVCGLPGEPPDAGPLPDLLRAAVAGGGAGVHLREKRLGDRELTGGAPAAGGPCGRVGAMLVVHHRPRAARQPPPPSPAEIDAADPALVDYIGVGPVYETPTKAGRPAVGLELVRYATANARVPFFAIGGLNASNVAEVTAAGAERIVVLRAIAEASDPEAAAWELRGMLGTGSAGGLTPPAPANRPRSARGPPA